MALRTSVGSGDWATAGTWDTGVPGNGDTVTIATGHTVTLNTEYSGITLGTITVNGELYCATTGKAYLKTNADIVGTGNIYCGESGTPLPSSRYMVFDFAGTAKGFNSANLGLYFYCWQPTNKYVLTTGVEASAQTEIVVATNVDEWQTFLTASGLTGEVNINDVGGTLPDSESRAATMSGTTVTLGSGLTNQKETGSLVILVTRNIRIFNSTQYPIDSAKSGSIFGCEINGGTRGINNGTNYTLSGVISGCTYGTYYGTGFVISGIITGCTYGTYYSTGFVISGIITGGTYTLNNGTGHTISGLLSGALSATYAAKDIVLTGIIEGCTYATHSTCIIVGGIIQKCTYGLYASNGLLLGAVLDNTTDVYNSKIESYDSVFSGDTENDLYATLSESCYSPSYDHDGVAGAFKSWTAGGITIDEVTEVPTGFDVSYKHTCESASYWNFRQDKILLMPGETVEITGWFKLADDHSTYPPKLEIIDPADDPLLGGTALDSDAVATPGGSASWQEVSVSYANTAAYAKVLLVRASCKRASGDVYEAWEIEKVTADDIATAVRTELTTELARILKGLPDAIPGENGGLPTTNGTKVNQTVDLTAGQEISADVTKIGGVAQSATDLKDFADSGYDPATHKVQGVVLTDTCTANTDLVSAASIIAALKASTGYSVGTLTFAEVVQIIASAVAGKVIDKAGVAGTIQHLDVEDGTTPIFENVPSNTTSPYRDPTIL